MRFLNIVKKLIFLVCPLLTGMAQAENNEPVSEKIIIKIELVDDSTKRPIREGIYIQKLTEFKEYEVAYEGPGKYAVSLNSEDAVELRVTAKGYMPYEGVLNKNQAVGQVLVLRLKPVHLGKTITLTNIYFPQGRAELLPESSVELNRLVTLLNQNPGMEIQVSGHTDNQGDEQKNLELSLQRAKAVKTYLIRKGISAARVEELGFGSSKPVAGNEQEDTRKLNRRVEFKVVKL